jgi:hypothetical protein
MPRRIALRQKDNRIAASLARGSAMAKNPISISYQLVQARGNIPDNFIPFKGDLEAPPVLWQSRPSTGSVVEFESRAAGFQMC